MIAFDKRWLWLGVLLIIIAFYSGSKYKEYSSDRQNQTMIELQESQPEANEKPIIKQIQVFVSGEVLTPGVYTLPEDARIHDAITAAGGFTLNAQSKSVNMAAKLRDGEALIIPGPNDDPESKANSNGSLGMSSNSGRVNINTASVAELENGLPGIGPTLAQRIIDYRENTGYFKKIEDLKNVSGIGDKRYDALKELIDV